MAPRKRTLIKHASAIKIVLVIATVLALLAFPYLPRKTLDVYPSTEAWWGGYSDVVMGGNSQFEYENESYSAITCTMAKSDSFNMCGNTLVFAENNIVSYDKLTSDIEFAIQVSPEITRDFSGYTGVWLEVEYHGDASYIHFFLKNHEPRLDQPAPDRQFRPQSVGILTSELHEPVYIRLKEFKVSDWWVNQFSLHRTESSTRFDKIQAIGVEIKEQKAGSEHHIEIKSIKFTGEWISKETFYLAIILALATALGLEGGVRVYGLYHRNRAAQKSLDSLSERNQQLRSAAFKDELTQLLNRRAIHEIIVNGQKLNIDKGMAVLVIDIDHFKKFNDTYGHALGDKVLVNVAHALKQASRDYDQVARWGGEEFVVITLKTESENLLTYAEKLRQAVATTPVCKDGSDEPIYVTISIGISQTRDGDSFETTFERADQALYQSKAMGRNCCTLN